MEITQQNIEDVVGSILSNARDELISKTESELEDYWYFRYDKTASKAWNLYKFTQALDLYCRQCRTWEEYHYGYSCVVERVRDKYLMPKIQKFLELNDD